jgi:hypothetical protein
MMSGETLLKPQKDVIHTRLASGEVVLLHLGAEQYFSLNETGSRIWALLDGKTTLQEISTALQARYDVSDEDSLKSVTELAEQLVAQKLVTVETFPAA